MTFIICLLVILFLLTYYPETVAEIIMFLMVVTVWVAGGIALSIIAVTLAVLVA